MTRIRALVSNLALPALTLSGLAFSTPAFAGSWEWEWELLPPAWVDDVLVWSDSVQQDYTGAQIKAEFIAPDAENWCQAGGPCNDAIIFKQWAHYFLDIPAQDPLPEPFPLGCTTNCLVEG